MAGDRMSIFAAAHSRTFATPEQLANEIADWIVDRANAARGRFAFCLSGGETPKRLYELLAAPARRERFPWQRTHCFWGDERVVAHDDPRSNFHMAWDALLRHVPVRPENIHAVPTERGSAASGAAEYEATLKRFYGAETLDAARPLFDLTLLGLGEDGHIASLFPGSPALAEAERWAVGVTGSGALDRVSLTYPALASSADTAFVIVGARKRDVLLRLRAGDTALPAARLQSAGAVFCFADRAATATPAFS
jgi:6-phosphogluconolactonase